MAGFLDNLRKKAEEAIAKSEIALVRGKIAGTRVCGRDGSIVVDAGHVVDDAVIERAISEGLLHALAQSVLAAHAQDAKERAAAFRARTPEGQEEANLDSVDLFIEARGCVGRIAVLEVTDIRGNTVVPAGTEITEQEVRRARAAGQLEALIYSASQPQPPRDPAKMGSLRGPADFSELPAESRPQPPPSRPPVNFGEWPGKETDEQE